MYYVERSLTQVSGLLECTRKHPKLAVSGLCTGGNKAWAVAMKASFWCGHCSVSEAPAVDPKHQDTLVCCNGRSFLYPVKPTLSLLINVPREERHSANSAGPSPGLLLD